MYPSLLILVLVASRTKNSTHTSKADSIVLLKSSLDWVITRKSTCGVLDVFYMNFMQVIFIIRNDLIWERISNLRWRERAWSTFSNYGSNWNSRKETFSSNFFILLQVTFYKSSPRFKTFFEDDFQPKIVPNSKGRIRIPGSLSLPSVMECEDQRFVDLIQVKYIKFLV